MDATVRAFNKLPRLQSSPSGLSNHWYFSVKHVPFDPPGDMLHIVHPRSHFMTCEGPAQIMTLFSPEAQADAIVPLLLKAFVGGVNKGPDGRALPDAPPFVPWTWATGDRNLADAVEAKLRKIGARADLCTVQSSKKEEEDVANEAWKGFLDTIGAMTGQKRSDAEQSTAQEPAEPGVAACDVCKKSGSGAADSLKRCARCQIVMYCSQECQRSDWKSHKRVCKAPGSSGAAGIESMRASVYYNKVAHTVPEARHLAGLVNLTLPTGSGAEEDIDIPIRRLVVTGKDTKKNLALLLGPDWKGKDEDPHIAIRLTILLPAPPGSPNYARYHGWDEGAPFISPRPANDAEEEMLEEIRDIREKARAHLGSRKQPTSDDMQKILTSFGSFWFQQIPVYMQAVNNMDQGVPVRSR